MAGLSVKGALGAGFRIIGRSPAAPLIWGLLYAPILIGPFLISFGIKPPHLTPGEATAESMAQFWGAMLPFLILQPLLFVASIVVQALLCCAVFRAVLEPDNRHRFYLRLGMQEVWVALVQFCLGFVIIIPVFGALAVLLPIGVGVYFISGGGDAAYMPVTIYAVGAGLAVLALTLWLYARLSMAAPMTFADRNFRLLESWPLTRGHAGKLMLLGFLIMLLVIGVYLLLVLAVGGTTLIAMLTATAISAVNGGADGRTVGAGAIFFFALFSVLSGYLWAITLGPWADAFRQLRGEGAAPAHVPDA